MAKYNTGNPVGSSDPRDLYDNSGVTDNLVTGTGAAYPDRLGRSRKSWAGMESEFNADQAQRVSEFDASQSDRQGVFRQYLISAGYQFAGDYAAGIQITQYNQVVRDIDGEFWRASGSTALPYTTTGGGLPEGGAFVNAGDAVLRQELGGSPGNGQGAAIVNGATVNLSSVAEAIHGMAGAGGRAYRATGFHAGSKLGAQGLVYDSGEPKANHGKTGWSPTVPPVSAQSGTTKAERTANYLNGAGETDPAGTGLFMFDDTVKSNPEIFGSLRGGADDFEPLKRAFAYGICTLILGETYDYTGTLSQTKGVVGNGATLRSGDAASYITVDAPCVGSGLNIDANNVAEHGIFFNTSANFSRCVVSNTVPGAVTPLGFGFAGEITTGEEVILNECEARDCPKGFRIIGSVPGGIARLINCRTSGTTGTESNIYMLLGLDVAEVIGGSFTGDPSSSGPNVQQSTQCVISGGVYRGMVRGPTIGRDNLGWAITGNTVMDMSFSGISLDLRSEAIDPPDGEYPRGFGIVSGNTVRDVRRPYYAQGKNFAIVGNNFDTYSDFARINGADNVWLDGNHYINGPSNGAIEIGSGSTVKVGKESFDQDLPPILTYRKAGDGNHYIFSNIFYTSTNNETVPVNTEVIAVDCSAGSIAVRLPTNSNLESSGKQITVLKTDASGNPINVSVEGGNGTVVGGNRIIVQGAAITYTTLNPADDTWYSIGGFAKARYQADSAAADLGQLKSDFNALLDEMRYVGLMAKA